VPTVKKRIIWLDVCFIGSLAFVSLTLLINIFVRSLHLVYIVIFLVLGVLGYATWKHKNGNSLRDLWILGLLSLILYPLIDHFFEAKLNLVTYLTNDPKIVATPLYVLLYWLFGVLLFGYCYLRLRKAADKVFVASLAVGLFAATSATFIENLFNATGFYRNTSSYLMIWHIPIYIPLGYVFTFALMPLYLRHKYISGLLLYGFTGLGWYLFSHVISWLVSAL
jgi:hypothetical protein